VASNAPRYLRIAGGTVYDPANAIDGAVADVWISAGKVVEPPPEGAAAAAETIDAAGLVVMPGGVDMHTHVAGPKLSLGRLLRPEEARADRSPGAGPPASSAPPTARSMSTVPTPAEAGRRYAAMGYTTIVEAAIPPLFARQTHQELDAIPYVDKGFLTLMGNNTLLLDALHRGDRPFLRDAVAWLLSASRGYGIKLANPGGVENWKWRAGGNVAGLDDDIMGHGVTPRAVIMALAEVASELGLPHRVHLHANNLGGPLSFATMAETIAAVDGRPVHLAHLQFSAYGARARATAASTGVGAPLVGALSSRAAELAELVNAHPNLTLDVGQVVFGEATTMSADAPLQAGLHRLTGNRWVNADVENETGTGVMPYHFSARNYANAVQWTAGLELFLLVADPWRLALTTDHPNGGPFTAYPGIIRLLMDADHRAEWLTRIHERAARRSTLRDLSRVYSLYEIAVITRAAPARILGLPTKGHLGAGADADVAIYRPHADREAMFARPAYILKDGVVVARDGAIVAPPFAAPGRTLFVSPPYDPAALPLIREHFARAYTVALDNYAVGAHEIARPAEVPCTP
jgi:formylmethanofuran dehydrogenase subunit A